MDDDYETVDGNYNIQTVETEQYFYKWNELNGIRDMTMTGGDNTETSRYTQAKEIRKTTSKPQTTQTSSYTCPICKEPPIRTCRCLKRDSACKNGHQWYTDVGGNIKLGSSH
jgi:uncharacterized protein YmfQ (DUF2313 family)